MDIAVRIFFPLLYLVLIAWLLQRHKTLRASGFSGWFIVTFFVGKCLAGFLYSYISLKFFPNRGDIWVYYDDGLDLFKTLIQQPSQIDDRLRDMFSPGTGSALESGSGAARAAFEGIKFLHFIFNFFSWGNLYTNTILFNGLASLVFLKCWSFLKIEWRSWIPGAWLFLFPSAFFYTAGIHKEGIMFILIAWLIPLCYKFWIRTSFKKVIAVFIAMALFVFFKLFVAALFAASILLYWLMEALPSTRKLIFFSGLLGAVALFFVSEGIWPGRGLPSMLVRKQQEFLALEASSSFAAVVLEPVAGSFIKAMPQALYNVFLRPLPGQGDKSLYYLYTLEIFLFWAWIMYIAVKSRFRFSGHISSMVLCLLLFAFFNLVIIGYTIPNIGAITRYRSIFLPFIGLFAWWLFCRRRLIATANYNWKK